MVEGIRELPSDELGDVEGTVLATLRKEQGKELPELMFSMIEGNLTPLNDINPAIPVELSEFVLDLLEPEPGQRLTDKGIIIDRLNQMLTIYNKNN